MKILYRSLLAVLFLMLGARAEMLTPFPLLDFSGHIHELGQNDTRQIRAFVFLGPECPISRAMIPTLNALHGRFAKDGRVALFGVISDGATTREESRRFIAEWKIEFPVLHDASGLLADALKPTHVPEAFVFDGDGRPVYRGAIDNAYEDIGRRRAQVEKHFLADAISAALDGKNPVVARTTSVGCIFEDEPKISGTNSPVTFSRDIAPIIFARCANCHREGQVAPFALTNFVQAAKHAKQIAKVTGRRVMPPWMPESGHEEFVGDRRLTDREMALFKAWAGAGAPRGDPKEEPPLPKFAEGWRLGDPDLIVRMQEPFTLRADGADILQNFVIPVPTTEDKLVAAIEFHPGNPKIVHHAVLFLDDKGAARKLDAMTLEPGYENFGGPGFAPSGALGGWSVGNTARRLPNEMGRYLKQGSDIVAQIHYHPDGRVETDQSEIGIYFVKKPLAESLSQPAKLVGSIWMANYEMDIPAGVANYRKTTSYTLPRDVILVGAVPHMHLIGHTMNVTATLPSGKKKTLIDVPNWDYNWQDEYYYQKPFPLPAGTRLDVEAVYDNSADNPSNPNSPPKRVTWGDGTLNEMMFCFFLLTAENIGDLMYVINDNLQHDAKQPRRQLQ